MPPAAAVAVDLSPDCRPVAVVPARTRALGAEHALMAPGQVDDLAELASELQHLVHEERQLSAFRRRLHEQIDNGFPNELTLNRERVVSAQRRALHLEIDALRLRLAPGLHAL
jgi:hypothetical protein